MTLDELQVILGMIGIETDGLRPFGRDKNQVQIPCPLAPFLHPSREDKHPSLSIKFGSPTEWTVFKCWACKECGKLWQLVDSYAELNKRDDLKEVALRLIESDKPSLSSRLSLIGASLDSYVKPRLAPVSILPDGVLTRMMPVRMSERASDYLLGRKIAPSVWETFDLRYDDRMDRIVFPVRNARGQLVGAVGRLIGLGDKRYHNYFEFPAGRSIGGANVLNKDNHRVLVVEGFFDVMNAYQHLSDKGYDTICTWRAEMTQEQADLIIGLDKNPIICYDMDDAGKEGWAKSKKFLGPYTTRLKRASWENPELDFGDMTPPQLLKVLSDVHSALF